MGTDRRGIIRFTIENMIKQCKFKIRTGEKESVSQFKKILYILQRQSIIHTLTDDENIICSPLIENYKLKDLIMCSLNIDLTNKYVELDTKDKNKIYSYNEEKVNHLKLLLYYCYIKCRMYKRQNNDDIEVTGGRAEVAYPTFKVINEDLNITDDTIDKYNKILIGLDLIRMDSAGNWYHKDDPNKILKDSVNFYTLFTDEETASYNLKEGIKYWKKLDFNLGKVFTNSKEYKNNNKRLNGELGSIIKKEKYGTATEKDIDRKNEILDLINVNDEQYAIQTLLESNPDTLLSDIYYGFNSNKKAEMYYNIEKSLGLLNTGDELEINFEYYKWVMVNYNKDEHDFYANCVKNKRREILSSEDIIGSIDSKPKHKGLNKKGKPKEVINDDSEFIAEMGWDKEIEEENDEFIDWDEE
jgi:hypothetical protein